MDIVQETICMKDTATVTWITWLNYGSYLQAYALQQVVQRLGYNNAIIDDERFVYPYGNPTDLYKRTLPLNKRIKFFIKQWLLRPNNRKLQIERQYKKFRRKHLVIDNSYKRVEELNQRYDVFIAGSDQIWAPTKEVFKPFYYLDFATKKRISYAASINSDHYPEEYIEPVSELLKDFSHISVREEAGKGLLKSFVQKEIEVTLDPTLLLTSKEWQSIADKRKSKSSFILCYLLSFNETYLQFARSFAKQKNLPLYFFSNNEQYSQYADVMLASGPSQFVSAFRDASFVLTDSFHGTIFSILHEKEFITFKRFKGAEGSNQNERLNNLFSITGIEGRFFDEQELFESPIMPIDYEAVNKSLDKWREKSVNYLRKALSE